MNKTRYERRSDFCRPELGAAAPRLQEIDDDTRLVPGRLTGQESRVVAELLRGCSNRQIARRLDLSEHTVKFHMRNILRKFGVRSRMLILVHSGRFGTGKAGCYSRDAFATKAY